MFEGTDEGRTESDDVEKLEQPDPGHPVADYDVGTPEGGPGKAKEEATQPIADDGEKGQTTSPAAADDVGVPENPGADKEE